MVTFVGVSEAQQEQICSAIRPFLPKASKAFVSNPWRFTTTIGNKIEATRAVWSRNWVGSPEEIIEKITAFYGGTIIR